MNDSPDVAEVHDATVPFNEAGHRLDQVLARMFPQYSRAQLQRWIREGHATIDGETRRPRDTVFGGERVCVRARVEDQARAGPEAIDLTIVYKDDDLMVVDKPPGLVVHPGAGNAHGTLVNGLLHADPELSALPRAGLVHRLDKDTSGLLIVARTAAAFATLTQAMSHREISREYIALCVGALSGGGTIDAPIGRHPVDRKKMAVNERGRDARTHYRVLKRYRGHTLVAVTLDTGRTHQIRVHFAHKRWPLVGDRTYGRPALPRKASEALREALTAFGRQALHARRLTLAHPTTGEMLHIESPLPDDLKHLVELMDAEQAVT
ncbi:MAG: 23S rRNA pseudouridine(1911/1915/1917) synthase RluD [Pseudomonadota bacterium]